MFRTWVVAIFLVLAFPVRASVTLYSCQDAPGHAILQDKPIEHCENQKTYEYTTESDKPAEGLRPSEIRALTHDSTSSALEVSDPNFQQCTSYQADIRTTLIDIQRVPTDSLFVRESVASLEKNAELYQHFCGKEYPGLNTVIQRLKSHIDN